MKNITIILLLLFSFTLLKGQTKQSINEKFTSKELNEDLDMFIQGYNDIYPSLYRYRTKSSVDSFLLKIRANIKDSMTEMDFYKQISSFCSFIGDVHSGIIPSKNYLKYEKDSLKKFPFKVDIVNKKLYVLENYSNDFSIKQGSEILSINNKPSIGIINELMLHITTDGYNQTYKYHYVAKHFGKFYSRIIGSPEKYDIIIKKFNEQRIDTISIDAKIDSEISDIKKQKYPFEYRASLDFKEINNQISFLRISSFNETSTNKNGMQFESFIDSVFQILNNNKTPNLIVDLRWNGGGDDKNGALLFSYLTDKPFQYYDCLCVAITANDKIKTQSYFEDPESIDEFKGYLSIDSIGRKIITLDDHPNTSIQQPQINNYKGKVYVIINGKSSSATSEFCSITRYHKRGVFIGEETGGGFYGNTSGWDNTLILPNTQLQFQMNFIEYRTAVIDSEEPNGRGVIPDIEIKRNIKDILNNYDTELEFTIDLIRSK